MTTSALDQPPRPAPDADSAGYWEATAAGQLAIGHCPNCGHWHQPPVERCVRCDVRLEFDAVSRLGTVFSRISVHQPTVPGHLHHLPYEVVLVELDEQAGLRLAAIPGSPGLAIGDRVELALAPLAGSPYQVPRAEPLGSPA